MRHKKGQIAKETLKTANIWPEGLDRSPMRRFGTVLRLIVNDRMAYSGRTRRRGGVAARKVSVLPNRGKAEKV